MQTEYITLNEKRDVRLTAYIQPVAGEFWGINKRPAIIVIPGGGYKYCSAREADPVAFVYLQAGYQVFILKYSIGDYADAWENTLSDYEQAYETILSKADGWHIDTEKMAVIGFSAGGHLAAAAAAMSKHRPAACILGYPVIIDETAKWCCPTAPDIAEKVDDKTCPCFVFSSRTDGLVKPENTLRFLDALSRHGIPFEAHIYAWANHGFSTCEPCITDTKKICSRTSSWVKDSVEWLGDTLGVLNVTEPDWEKLSKEENGDE